VSTFSWVNPRFNHSDGDWWTRSGEYMHDDITLNDVRWIRVRLYHLITITHSITHSNTIVHELTRTCSSVTIWVNKLCTSSRERPHQSSVRVITSCTHSRERALKSSVWVEL
jgi:hypothetical protein